MAAVDQEPGDAVVHPRSYQDESYLRGFLGTVGDLQKAGVLQDVVLEVEDRRFPCHRLVLSAASPYFRAMFTNDMAESRQKTVVLQGLDADMFEEILSYIYSGTLQLSLDKVQPLYQAADLLQLDYVRDTCSSYMAMNVERSTCVDLYKFADAFSVDSVLRRSMQTIHIHFVKVASSEEFCSLSVNQLTEIISHDELDVKEETTVWEAVVRWVQHSREDRLHHLPSILPHIRFNLLTSDYTTAILEHPLVREDPGSSEVIRNAVQKGYPDPKPRLGMVTMDMALVHCSKRDRLLFMNPQQGKYISCRFRPGTLPDPIATTITSDNNIYILSREPGDYEQLYLTRYNHAENVWERANMSMLDPHTRNGVTVNQHLVGVGLILYYLALEGRRDDRTLLRMTKYNQRADQWQECSRLILDKALYRIVALPCGPHLYFLSDTEVHRYDPSQDCWISCTPPMVQTDFWTAVAMGTEIFCAGMRVTQTMVYNTVSDSWQELQGLPDPENFYNICISAQLFVLENQLHILLKTDDFDIEDSTEYLVYVYDRCADAWRDLQATLPAEDYTQYSPWCPVTRMYLPYLKRT